jgi:beta-lactamase regulating signal transducer with metallopeptidase domain
MLSWMIYVALVTTLIACAAVAGDWVARSVSLPTRVVWCVALVATAVTGVVSWRAPTNDAAPATIVSSTQAPARSIGAPLGEVPLVDTPVLVGAVLAWVWIGLSIATALFLLVTTVQLRRRQRMWNPADVEGERVFITDGLGPAVVGFFRPVIALPAWATTESDERLRLIIAHEREHLRAGDQRLIALAWIITIMMPWNIVAVWMIARLRHAIEIDCDARVVRAHRDVRAYGELLIEVSRRPAAVPTGLTAFAERPSNVERRIMALTIGMPRHAKPIAIGLSLAAAAAIAVACEIPRPVGPGARGASALKTTPPTTEVPAPLPAGAASTVRSTLARSFPAIDAGGTKGGQAVWMVAGRDGRVVSSFVGPTYSENEFRRVARQQVYDSLNLVAFNAGLKAANGAPIVVVWARDVIPWETSVFLPDRARALIRDSIKTLQPNLYSGLAAGQAIYFVLDWKAKRVERIWAAPALADAAAQWRYARAQFPERVVLYATNVDITTADGRQVPVVYLNRSPWAERY